MPQLVSRFLLMELVLAWTLSSPIRKARSAKHLALNKGMSILDLNPYGLKRISTGDSRISDYSHYSDYYAWEY